jgi:hypothetical protein
MSQGDPYAAHRVSLVYGFGSVRGGSLVMVGDELDFDQLPGDRVRKRRWWKAAPEASKQRLLPFCGCTPVRITSISQYSNATEIVVQFGRGRHTRLNLTAPRRLTSPGPYTVRAIRVHNVDGSETVPPMQPTADELGAMPCPMTNPWGEVARGVEAAPSRRRARPSAYVDWLEPEAAPEVCEEERPVRGWRDEAATWRVAVPPPTPPIQEVPRDGPSTRRRSVQIREFRSREEADRVMAEERVRDRVDAAALAYASSILTGRVNRSDT